MSKCFHGWRRKAGCLLLVIACALMGAWMRSWYYEDDIQLRIGRYENLECCSRNNSVICRWIWAGEDGPESHFEENGTIGTKIELPVGLMPDHSESGKLWSIYLIDPDKFVEWTTDAAEPSVGEPLHGTRYFLDWHQFRISEWISGGDGIRSVQTPYWMLVMASTLISASLILWKPRKQTQRV